MTASQRLVFSLILIPVLAACSSAQKERREGGKDLGIPEPRPGVHYNPQPPGQERSGFWQMGPEAALAASAAFYAGTAGRSERERSRAIAGTCLVVTNEDDRLGAPCNGAEIRLLDSQGKELAKMPANASGQFAFQVNEGRAYRVEGSLRSSKLKASGASGPHRMGDEVVLRIRR